MIGRITLELCIADIEDGLKAALIPEVDRIEFNSALESGGLTPSLASFQILRKSTDKKIICMTRPRKAGFLYTDSEKETMLADAKIFLDCGADGIVFGALNADHTIDSVFLKEMSDLIHKYQKEVVFHKAFDVTPDPFAACETLIRYGVNRILTSGQKASVMEGINLIAQLLKRYGNQIEILAGGGVNSANVRDIIDTAKLTSIHLSAKKTLYDLENYYALDVNEVRNVVQALSN